MSVQPSKLRRRLLMKAAVLTAFVAGLLLLPGISEAQEFDRVTFGDAADAYTANPIWSGLPAEQPDVFDDPCSRLPADWVDPASDTGAAPICDVSQSSDVAPLPVRPITEATLRAPAADDAHGLCGLSPAGPQEERSKLDTDSVRGLFASPPPAVWVAPESEPQAFQARMMFAPGFLTPAERPPTS